MAKLIEFHKPARFIPQAPKWRPEGYRAPVIQFPVIQLRKLGGGG